MVSATMCEFEFLVLAFFCFVPLLLIDGGGLFLLKNHDSGNYSCERVYTVACHVTETSYFKQRRSYHNFKFVKVASSRRWSVSHPCQFCSLWTINVNVSWVDREPCEGDPQQIFHCQTPDTVPSHWLVGGTVVERRSLTGELSLSCARAAADG